VDNLIVPIIVAVLVAWLTFRFAVRQDERRSSRERRVELYVDLLVEASAERDEFARDMTAREIGKPIERFAPDDRFPSVERRRLGARAAAYASPEVVRRWNMGQAIEFRGSLGLSDPFMAKIRADAALDFLGAQVRHELEIDRLPLWRRLGGMQHAEDALVKFLPPGGLAAEQPSHRVEVDEPDASR
jgi:hypothetical protein